MSAALGLVFLAAPIIDLRVWEGEGAARIEVVCGAACTGRVTEDGVAIEGVSETLTVPRPDAPIGRIDLAETGDGTRLTYETDRLVSSAVIAPCGPRAVCLDLAFASNGAPADAPPGDLRAALAAASGDPLAPPDCIDADEALQSDAYDLAAFRRVALCRAAAGRVREAAGLLDRLLTYRADPAAARARAVLAARLDGAGAPR